MPFDINVDVGLFVKDFGEFGQSLLATLEMEPRLYNLKPNNRWGEAYEMLCDILYGNR